MDELHNRQGMTLAQYLLRAIQTGNVEAIDSALRTISDAMDVVHWAQAQMSAAGHVHLTDMDTPAVDDDQRN